jgi:anionic cell wall polymer biosynthesis LytR-Cps2A-Psr (LCP) family protein
MELWELAARESIRDLVARYNANGDSGRFEQQMQVFAPDAVMELVSAGGDVRRYEGREQIATIFTGTKATWDATVAPGTGRGKHHIRHFVATHQIDVEDEGHARGRSYFLVVMPHGVDHWGRYVDEYEVRDGRWVITKRRALSDGGPGLERIE